MNTSSPEVLESITSDLSTVKDAVVVQLSRGSDASSFFTHTGKSLDKRDPEPSYTCRHDFASKYRNRVLPRAYDNPLNEIADRIPFFTRIRQLHPHPRHKDDKQFISYFNKLETWMGKMTHLEGWDAKLSSIPIDAGNFVPATILECVPRCPRCL
jgi:hypothetical protein